MKVTSLLVAMLVCASTTSAQQGSVRPAAPIPPATPAIPATPTAPAAPRPVKAPAAADLYGSGWQASVENHVRVNAELFHYDAEDFKARVSEQVREGQWRAEQAAAAAQDRLRDFQYNYDAYAPGVHAAIAGTGNIGTEITANFAIATLAQARWQEDWKQDRDPADSLFNSARDALNRGDWRRSADLFSQVYTKYPKSTRLISAAYYEAFARYRIGTTDELRTALHVLNDRAQGSPNTSNSNEVSVLTTRVRGALAQRGDADAARQLQADAQKGRSCDSEDMQVRSEALSALAQSDMVAATPMLRRVLDKKDPCSLELRRRALSILLRRADTAATSAAISVARNNDETIDLRTDAISYLSRLPGDNALAALEDLMRTSNDRDIQRAAMRSLANTDNAKARQSIRAIIERNDVSEQLRVEALSTFERDRNSSAEDAAYLRSVYPKLQADRLKIATLSAIAKMPGAENEQFILSVARNAGESSELRANAISRMSRIPTISIADIGKVYDNADSRSMRGQVISVLSQRKEPEAIEKLGDIAKSGTDPQLRSQAINALNRKDDPRAKKIIQDVVGTP